MATIWGNNLKKANILTTIFDGRRGSFPHLNSGAHADIKTRKQIAEKIHKQGSRTRERIFSISGASFQCIVFWWLVLTEQKNWKEKEKVIRYL